MFASRVLRSCLNLKKIPNTSYRTISVWHKPLSSGLYAPTSAIINKSLTEPFKEKRDTLLQRGHSFSVDGQYCQTDTNPDTRDSYSSIWDYGPVTKNHFNLQWLPFRQSGTFHLPYTLAHLRERVLLVLKLYDKIDPNKITLDSHFFEDCGLDSLDHVEVIIAMEDEFDFEIPEQYHYRLMRPKDVVQYVADRFDIFE